MNHLSDEIDNYVEESVMRKAFYQMVDGNDVFKNKSSVEMQNDLWIFRMGWISRGKWC